MSSERIPKSSQERVNELPLTGFYRTRRVSNNGFPSFAKEGWTRPREKCCEASFDRSGRGSCFKLPLICPEPVWIIGGLKQLPRLRQLRNGAISLWRSHPFFAKKGITLDRHVRQPVRVSTVPHLDSCGSSTGVSPAAPAMTGVCYRARSSGSRP